MRRPDKPLREIADDEESHHGEGQAADHADVSRGDGRIRSGSFARQRARQGKSRQREQRRRGHPGDDKRQRPTHSDVYRG